jgi:hypothetical protein
MEEEAVVFFITNVSLRHVILYKPRLNSLRDLLCIPKFCTVRKRNATTSVYR